MIYISLSPKNDTYVYNLVHKYSETRENLSRTKKS